MNSLCLSIPCCEAEPTESHKGTAGECHSLGVLEFPSGIGVSETYEITVVVSDALQKLLCKRGSRMSMSHCPGIMVSKRWPLGKSQPHVDKSRVFGLRIS
jgi:hypothetical protein